MRLLGGTASRFLAGALEHASMDDEQSRALEELTIDEDLPLLARILRYARHGTTLQRQVFVRELPTCVAEVGLEVALDELLPLFGELATDADATVRQTFAQAIPRVVELLAGPIWPDSAARSDNLTAPVAPPLTAEQTGPLEERAYRAVVDEVLPTVRTLIVGEGLAASAGGNGAGPGLARPFLTSPQVQPRPRPHQRHARRDSRARAARLMRCAAARVAVAACSPRAARA